MSTLDRLREFHRFVGEKLQTGDEAPSPEELLDEWLLLHPGPDDAEDVEEAIRDREAGDGGIPFDEFDRDFRERHKLPPTP
jgi:hypothetical protein